MNVKTECGFAAKQAASCHVLKNPRNAHPVGEVSGHGFGDVQGYIHADLIQQAHWSHGHAEIEHGFVEITDRDAGFEKISCLNEVGHEDAIHDKAGAVLDHDRQLPDLLDEPDRPLEDFG